MYTTIRYLQMGFKQLQREKSCSLESKIRHIKSREKIDVNLEDQNCTEYIPRGEWVQKNDKIVTQRRKVKNDAYIYGSADDCYVIVVVTPWTFLAGKD